MTTPIAAWSQDGILAHRSGYHVLADYLAVTHVVTQRTDPRASLPLFVTRILRRFAFTRWYTGGSWEMEKAVLKHCRSQPTSPIHLLWCDRDLGFIDLLVSQKRHPLIGTFHQCPDDLAKIIRRPSALKNFAAIIIMSEIQRAYFEANGVPTDRIHTILHGVDVDYFTPQAPNPPAGFTVLAVGGTRRDFAQLRTVATVLQNSPHIVFDVVAPRDKQHWFNDLPNVRYHVRVTDATLLKMYRSASCLLHLAENATANNAMLEALACGTPVVSQRVGGIPEYLVPGCSMLSDRGDVEAVIGALLRLAGDRALQQDMRVAARAHALSHDWRVTAEATMQIYRKAA